MVSESPAKLIPGQGMTDKRLPSHYKESHATDTTITLESSLFVRTALRRAKGRWEEREQVSGCM